VGLYQDITPTSNVLGDCSSFAISGAGGSSRKTPSDYAAQGYTGGFETTLVGVDGSDLNFICWHFHTTDFMLTTPTVFSTNDTSSDFITRYFPGVTSGSSCIIDSSVTYDTANPGSLTIG